MGWHLLCSQRVMLWHCACACSHSEPPSSEIRHYLSSCHRLQVFNPSTADHEHGCWSATGAQPSCLDLLMSISRLSCLSLRAALHVERQLLQGITRIPATAAVDMWSRCQPPVVSL